MRSFFQMLFAVVKQRNILEIILSTVASISFFVIVTFAVIIRRLYMKNMSYRKIEQGEFWTKLDPTSSLLMLNIAIVVIRLWRRYLVI